MKIFFSKKEYRSLIDMLFLSDWMLHSYSVGEAEENGYTQLRKKILSFAQDMDVGDIVEYSKEDDEYFEAGAYEDELYEKFVKPYEEAVFWDELAAKLSKRDLIKKMGEDAYRKMKRIDRAMERHKLEEKYAKEFRTKGLERIMIDEEK